MMAVNHESALLNVLQDVTIEPETKEEHKEVGTDDSYIPPPPTTVTIKTLFSHPDSHPIVLDLALLTKYNAEWFEWEPETVQHRVSIDFGNVSDLNISKIMAMKTLHVSDRFWEAWEVFVWCTMPLNGIFPDFEMMQVPSVAQCLVSVDIADRVRMDVHWSEEVKAFIEQVHLHDGIFVPQPPIDSVAVVDANLNFNIGDVKKRWPEVRSSQVVPSGSTPEAEQLRRMLMAFEYLEDSRQKLRAQLPLVGHV